MTLGDKLGQLFDPAVPDKVRKDYLLHSARRLRAQGLLLFGGLGICCPAIALSLGQQVPTFVGVGLPLAMSLISAFAILWLMRHRNVSEDPAQAEIMVRLASRCAVALGVTASLWCTLNWIVVRPEAKLYFPLLCALGMMSIAYAVASVRRAAILALLAGLAPITLLMMFAGTVLDLAAAFGIVIAACFQIATLSYQHRNLIELLQLQRQTRKLSQTDALTGLFNRRALLDFATAPRRGGIPMRLLLIDVDRFKDINDSHGHEMGDEVLRRLAAILARRRKPGVCVARLGGEEFALLGTSEALPEAVALAMLVETRNTPMPHGGQVTVSIGVAEGMVGDEPAWRKLYTRADTALYCAKRDGRNRMERCAETVAITPDKGAGARVAA